MIKYNVAIVILWIFFFQSLFSQTVSTWISNSGVADDMIYDGDGNIFGSGFSDGNVYRIDANGNTSVYTSGIQNPNGLAFDDSGNLYVVGWGEGTIWKVDTNGDKTPLITGLNIASGMQRMLNADTLLVSNPNQQCIDKVSFDGALVPFINDNQLNGPVGIEYNDNDELMLANFSDGRVFRYTEGQPLELIVNMNIPGAGIGFIECIGDFVYATMINANTIYRANYDGEFLLIAGTGTAGSNNGNGDVATFSFPNGILESVTGDSLYISDFGTTSIRVISDLNLINSVESFLPTVVNELKVYPNPVTHVLNVDLTLNEAIENLQLNVLDITGKEVHRVLLSERAESGMNQFTMKMPLGVPPGNYFYQLYDESRVLAGGKLQKM